MTFFLKKEKEEEEEEEEEEENDWSEGKKKMELLFLIYIKFYSRIFSVSFSHDLSVKKILLINRKILLSLVHRAMDNRMFRERECSRDWNS